MSRMRRLLQGARAMPIGVRAVFQSKKSFLLFLLPFFFSLIFVISLVILNTTWLLQLTEAYIPSSGTEWYGPALATFIYVLVFIFSLVFSMLFGFVLLNVIAIPFHTLMCEKYLKETFQFQPIVRPFGKRILTFFYFLGIGLIKSLMLLILGSLCFLGTFIPVVSVFFAFIAFLLIAYDCSDVVFEVKEWNLKARTNFFRKNIWEFSGFAMAIGLTFLVPLLNFILLPGFILGSAYLVESLEKRTNV